MSIDSPDSNPQPPAPAEESQPGQETISRREALKLLVISAGALSSFSGLLPVLPVRWMDPTVQAGTPTAHAIASLLYPNPKPTSTTDTPTATTTNTATEPPVTASPPPIPTQPNPNASPTPVPATPTPPSALTSAAGGVTLSSTSSSTNLFYWGNGSCGPLDAQFQVVVSDPSLVTGVVLFFHLQNKGGSGSTPWNNGVAMSPLGSGAYGYDLFSKNIPAYNTYNDAWLIYQFAVEGSGGTVLFRSPAYSNVELKACIAGVGGAPFAGPTPHK